MKKIFFSLLLFSLFPIAFSQAEELPLKEADFPPSYREIIALINASDYQKGYKKLQRYSDTKKNNPTYFYLKGLVLRQLKQYNKAEGALKKSLSFKGSKSDVIAELGLCYLGMKQFDKAEVALNEALWFDNLKRYPKAEIFYQMGEIYREKGKKAKAESYYREALKANPGYPVAALRLAEMVFAANDKRQAVALLRGALDKAPNNSQVRLKYVEFLTTNVNPLTNSDSTKQAYEALTPMLRSGECSGSALRICAKVLSLNNKGEEVERLITEVRQKNPKNPELLRLEKQLKAEKEAKLVQPVDDKVPFKVKKKTKTSKKKRKR